MSTDRQFRIPTALFVVRYDGSPSLHIFLSSETQIWGSDKDKRFSAYRPDTTVGDLSPVKTV